MGNIWMFPTRVSLYGGASFLIPYFIFVVLIGSTGVIGEMSFGRAARSGPVGAFGMACESKGKKSVGEAIGLIPVVGSMALAIGYTVVMGWILKYCVGTFSGATLAADSVDGFAANFGGMASAYGNNGWQASALILAFAILIFGIGRGIEKANKIMMPLFFFLFLGLDEFFQVLLNLHHHCDEVSDLSYQIKHFYSPLCLYVGRMISASMSSALGGLEMP
jgi:NSS family neurotransmitter:Na+ symporter